MLYWLQIYALVAALIFAGAGLVILGLFAWFKTKAWWPLNPGRMSHIGSPVAIPDMLAKGDSDNE